MRNTYSYIVVLLLLLIFACQPEQQTSILYPDVLIKLDAERAKTLSENIQKEVAIKLAEGLELTLWASDSLVQDPVAISIDETGGIYYTHAERITNSEFDIRGYEDWMTTSQSWESVEDRRKFLRETFDPSKSDENTALPDLNNDGSHDWHDLTVEKEKVWRLEDTDGDGLADQSRLYLEDFHEEISDLANGIEYFNGEVFIAVGPDLWRTADHDGDGISDDKESISHGYAVHIGFGAHGMSGAVVGPDGRIWWGIGDIGMNVVDQTGKRWKYPNQGVIVRSELDGSNFEVFSAGHRNTHEFAFDKYGNLISEDNDGDHPGERERLVYIVEGSDSGWRSNWQYGKYTDPDNNGYNVWMDERLSVPRWDGQAAYILPPITNYVNGPTGLVYNPGTALSPEWYDHFFVAEFRGTPARSPIHAFKLKPKGATFELEDTKEVIQGTLPTGLDFGPDGALYFGDWIDGWGAKDYGRMWKLDVTEGAEAALRASVQKLMATDFKTLTVEQLEEHLSHQDMRIRLKAQFDLVRRGANGQEVLESVSSGSSDQLARIHALWGLGQLVRNGAASGSLFINFVDDKDPQIVAQAAKLIGDVRYKGAENELIALLSHTSERVQFFAAEALGRIESKAAIDPILKMLERNDDEDAWLRHAGCYALSRIGESAPLVNLANSPSRALRICAVVVLRRMRNAGVAEFLKDKDEYIIAEAARAINDDLSIPDAIPALAALLSELDTDNEVILRRAINANLREGKSENIDRLVSFANDKNNPAAMRGESLAALSTWSSPSLTDRVDGRYRGKVEREASEARNILDPAINDLLTDKSDLVQIAACKIVEKLGLQKANPILLSQYELTQSDAVKSQILSALSAIDSKEINQVLEVALQDKSASVRSSALAIVPTSNIAADKAIELFKSIMKMGTISEKQAVLSSVNSLEGNATTTFLSGILDNLTLKKVEPEIELDIIEAIEESGSTDLNDNLQQYISDVNAEDKHAIFDVALEGGDRRRGQNIFYEHKAAQCVRCHAIWEFGGDAGPSLTGVGDRLSKNEILESLIDPSANISSGYGVVSLTLKDGDQFAGFFISEDEESLSVKEGKGEVRKISKDNITERNDIPSSMPSVEHILTKREIRDLVAFLSQIKME